MEITHHSSLAELLRQLHRWHLWLSENQSDVVIVLDKTFSTLQLGPCMPSKTLLKTIVQLYTESIANFGAALERMPSARVTWLELAKLLLTIQESSYQKLLRKKAYQHWYSVAVNQILLKLKKDGQPTEQPTTMR